MVLLGDGEFDGARLVNWMEQVNWQYACRTALDTLVFYQGRWVALQDLPLEAKQEAFFTDVLFTQSAQVGPVNILAISFTGVQIGMDIALARIVLSIVFGVGIGMLMAWFFCADD